MGNKSLIMGDTREEDFEPYTPQGSGSNVPKFKYDPTRVKRLRALARKKLVAWMKPSYRSDSSSGPGGIGFGETKE